jgi:putative peptide zinc metalloprotease protein
LLFIPWPARTSSSGYLRPAEIFPVYAPEGAQVVALPVTNGGSVRAGEPILQLASPELMLHWRQATALVETLQAQVTSAGVNAAQRQDLLVLQEKLASARAELAGVQAALEQYAPHAPFDGEVRDVDPDLKIGNWVGRGERLAILVQPGKWRVETYLDEDALRRIRIGDRARFYADGLEGPTLALAVETMDRDATRVLTTGLLAAPFGGSVVTREKNGQLLPERAVYRVTLVALDPPGSLGRHSWRGAVVIRGAWEAPGVGMLRSILATLWREAGF